MFKENFVWSLDLMNSTQEVHVCFSVCLLAKYLMDYSTNLTETPKKERLNVHLQPTFGITQFRQQINFSEQNNV